MLALYPGSQRRISFHAIRDGDIQARLLLSDKTFGGLVDDSNLQNYYAKRKPHRRVMNADTTGNCCGNEPNQNRYTSNRC